MAISEPSADHTRKRQYQPSIDSFFHRNVNTSAGSGSPSRLRSPLSPPLPVEIQASLLSQGMRTRKAVAEGYKTHKTMPEQSFPFPSTAPTQAPPVRPVYSTSNSRELAPLCGLHKIGGFNAPPSSAPAAFPTNDELSGSMPALSMSQSSIPSTQDSLLSTRSLQKAHNKRSYDEEVEDGLDAYFDEVEAEEAMPVPVEARRIAKLKSSPRKPAVSSYIFTGGVQGDFEEAPFLVPMETDA